MSMMEEGNTLDTRRNGGEEYWGKIGEVEGSAECHTQQHSRQGKTHSFGREVVLHHIQYTV
jgi:hypothetical protein